MPQPFTNAAYAWTGHVLAALRAALDRADFVEILPAILSKRFEPGARHSIAVIGDRAVPGVRRQGAEITVSGRDHYFLPVSHCVEKQLALEFLDRVYCVAPCLRLLMEGEDHSGRHLYSFFQIEIEWRTEDVDEVLSTTETLLAHTSELLRDRLAGSALLDQAALRRIDALGAGPYPRIPFGGARERVRSVGGHVNPHAAGDLTHAEEESLSRAADRPFWIVDYPEGVRDSLYRRTPSGLFATYDLILPGGYGEVATGGLRPQSADEIRAQAARFSDAPHSFYADWKARTGVQSGGLGFGLERLVRYCAGLESILDLRFAHDQGPNATIERRAVSWT